MKRPFDAKQFYIAHKPIIDATRRALAMDFETPAQRLINMAFEGMGQARFVGGDDRWEQVTAHLNGWEYRKPAKHLIARWSMA